MIVVEFRLLRIVFVFVYSLSRLTEKTSGENKPFQYGVSIMSAHR